MQIPLRGNNENVIGPDVQPVGDQFNRHRGIARKDFMELRGDDPQMIDDNDSDPKVGRQMSQEPDVRIKATG